MVFCDSCKKEVKTELLPILANDNEGDLIEVGLYFGCPICAKELKED